MLAQLKLSRPDLAFNLMLAFNLIKTAPTGAVHRRMDRQCTAPVGAVLIRLKAGVRLKARSGRESERSSVPGVGLFARLAGHCFDETNERNTELFVRNFHGSPRQSGTPAGRMRRSIQDQGAGVLMVGDEDTTALGKNLVVPVDWHEF